MEQSQDGPRRAERQEAQSSDSGERQASQRLFDDAYSRSNMKRNDCSQEANAERVPAFLQNSSDRICNRSSDNGYLDITNIYNQMAQSVARIDQQTSERPSAEERGAGAPPQWQRRSGPQGTAVAVGREGDTCFLATAAHVARGNQDMRIHNSFAVFADGSRFPTVTSAIDRGRDLAIMSVRMGADAERLCRPVEIADGSLRNGQPLASLGFPDGSRTMHIAPGQLQGQSFLGRFMSRGEIRSNGFDRQSNSILFDSAVHGGMSGGPVVDANGRLLGINSVSDRDTFRDAVSPRLDGQSLRTLLARARRN